jgi:hypothetical protein
MSDPVGARHGKRQMLGARTISAIGACVGFTMAVLVLGYGLIEPKIHAPAINDWLLVFGCPASVTLMALDDSKSYFLVAIAVAMVVASNTLWYGFLFAAMAKLIRSATAHGARR